ncbi:MAG: type I methionyl aminopeptidase, partial [bacterium]
MPWRKQQIKLKSPADLDLMAAAAKVLSAVFLEVRRLVAPGLTTGELGSAVEKMIRDAGCIPSFKGYNGFPAAACVSINEEVVHGIPSPRELQAGDIVGIDIGLIREGWHADSAETLAVGEISPTAQKLLQVTQECLALAVTQVQRGRRISEIGISVEGHARQHGFSVVESLVGHGIG